MATKAKQIIAFHAPVEIKAAKDDGTPARFEMVAYTGGELPLPNFEYPVIVDLEGAEFHRSVKANLNHERSQIVGHVEDKTNDNRQVRLGGYISGGGQAAEEVILAHKKGYPWEASIQANRLKLEMLPRGKKAVVNGQEFTGPKYIARKSTIYAVAFCDQGADDSTEVTIAASAASKKEHVMNSEVKAWAEGMGIDVENATPEAIATIEANYAGQNSKKKPPKSSDNPFEARKIEATRRNDIREIADKFIERRDGDLEYIEAVEKMHDHAIEAKMTAAEFRTEMYESMVPLAHTVPAPRNRERGLTDRVIEAAICETGKLSNLDKVFSDQELQAAHDRFPSGISLNELIIVAAQANGYRGPVSTRVSKEIHNAAFGHSGGRQIQAQGFSTIDVANIVAATANKFLHEGWMGVDLTPLRIASIRSVRNFQQITTVSLTGHLQFEKVGPDGELKHGTIGDLTYTNQADTYGIMLAITRKDYINDDLGALTAVPRRLGRGGALKLNDIFWTEFLGLVAASFFAAGNNNINTGVATMTTGGLAATETIFMNQTDPDGKPLGAMPAILLVPTALKSAAFTMMNSERLIDGTATAAQGDANIWRGRFRVESSPYISNSSYTGNTAVGWWMLANPGEIAVIEIAALNGRVEPIVETAETAFNTLGTQMRGYSDIGVNQQEYRGGVYADGGAS